jgi:hypothetical protein
MSKLEKLRDDKEERKKCEENPLYFYNNYMRREGDREFTQEEYDRHVEMVELYRHGKPLIGRTGKLYPMRPDEAFLKEKK